jgi:hypothetical protein
MRNDHHETETGYRYVRNEDIDTQWLRLGYNGIKYALDFALTTLPFNGTVEGKYKLSKLLAEGWKRFGRNDDVFPIFKIGRVATAKRKKMFQCSANIEIEYYLNTNKHLIQHKDEYLRKLGEHNLLEIEYGRLLDKAKLEDKANLRVIKAMEDWSKSDKGIRKKELRNYFSGIRGEGYDLLRTAGFYENEGNIDGTFEDNLTDLNRLLIWEIEALSTGNEPFTVYREDTYKELVCDEDGRKPSSTII